jgi:diguanylate cyclase (GGDEF)-like protein
MQDRSPDSPDRADGAGSRDPERPLVMVLNHHRDAIGPLCQRLRQDGYRVIESRSLAETQRLFDDLPPDLVILNPLILEPGSVELEIVERLQDRDAPVPVLLLVDDLRSLEHARAIRAPLRDFVLRPYSVDECAKRVEIAMRTRESILSLHRRAVDLEDQVSVDFKTGLLSERHFRQLLQVEFKRAQRHHTPLSLMLVDVDDFKGVNDATEYAFGDEVLRNVAQFLKRNLRETDFAARFGGDEFVVLLPHTTPAEAVQTALRIRKKVAEATIQSPRYQRQVTISIGIDTFDGIREATPSDLVRRANVALREAKKRGKNQVWLHPAAEPRADVGAAREQITDAE